MRRGATIDVGQSQGEELPFGQQPSYLFRDNDRVYGDEVSRFVVGTEIAEVKTARRCPWQNPFVERYGGTLRRELLDHVVLNEEHLKRLLKEFIEEYYHRARPHQGLQGDTPVPSVKAEPATEWESLGFDSRGRRFTSPLHPRGRLISYSTERPQNKRKTTHRDHHSCLVHPAHTAMACISRGHLFVSLDLGNQDFGG